jgi:hypothetical protein
MRLEQLRFVRRERQVSYGRVVLVSIEPAGIQAVEEFGAAGVAFRPMPK